MPPPPSLFLSVSSRAQNCSSWLFSKTAGIKGAAVHVLCLCVCWTASTHSSYNHPILILQEPQPDATTSPLPQVIPALVPEPFPVALVPTPVSSCLPIHTPGPSKVKVGILDFNFLMVLGKGSFGKVTMAASETKCHPLYTQHSNSDPTSIANVKEAAIMLKTTEIYSWLPSIVLTFKWHFVLPFLERSLYFY